MADHLFYLEECVRAAETCVNTVSRDPKTYFIFDLVPLELMTSPHQEDAAIQRFAHGIRDFPRLSNILQNQHVSSRDRSRHRGLSLPLRAAFSPSTSGRTAKVQIGALGVSRPANRGARPPG